VVVKKFCDFFASFSVSSRDNMIIKKCRRFNPAVFYLGCSIMAKREVKLEAADRKPSRKLNHRYASDVVKKDGKWKQIRVMVAK